MKRDSKDSGKREPWEGGYIHRQKDKRELFIIERQVGQERFHISTRAHNYTAAHEHLKRFESDPWAYKEEMHAGRSSSGKLHITPELVLKFRDWLTTRERPTTAKYAQEVSNRLGDWTKDLRHTDLRRMKLQDIKEAVDRRGTCRQHRIIALKVFCAWLRTEKFMLERKDDITLDLAVPQASPEKHRRRKAVPAQSVRKVLKVLPPAARDCILLLSHTGWHVSELERFVREADSSIAPGRGKVLAVLQTQHKTGSTTRTPVTDRQVLGAAQRLRKRGEVPRKLNAKLKEACRKAKVPAFTAGVMRHSVATWAVESGTPVETVSEFLGHKSKRTTATFYVDVAVPTRQVKLPKLF